MADRFSDIVSCLGGPAVTPSDIEWVVDLPAGKQLVDWIVAQVEGAPESDEAISQLSNEQGLKACLSDIALETEELETLRKAQQLNLAVQDSDQWLLSKYLSPSRLRYSGLIFPGCRTAAFSRSSLQGQTQIGNGQPSLASMRSDIIHRHEVQKHNLKAFQDYLPGPQEVEAEASRLQSSLLSDKVAPMAVVQELQELLERMIEEEDSQPAVIGKLAEEVRSQLQNAWLADQVAVLQAQGEILDMTITDFEQNLIPPITQLYQSLSLSDARAREAEALVSALVEEIEEIADDVQDVKNTRSSDIAEFGTTRESEDARLEARIKEILEKSHNWVNREAVWVTNLPLSLNEVTAGHGALLSTAYQNSHVNTSAPFSVPMEVADLAQDAERRIAELRASIDILTKVSSLIVLLILPAQVMFFTSIPLLNLKGTAPSEYQYYVLDKSSVINGLRFELWDRSTSKGSEGQPGFSPEQVACSAEYQRPQDLSPHCQVATASLMPHDITQHLVSDCSFAWSMLDDLAPRSTLAFATWERVYEAYGRI
ncbi:hypothetical protein GLOTRDRAFT_121484 [Gloeophyllum trabeum ATCC 11539]|uniref:Uncharacterized protein n=1 Tax=Gloeophyllum trabeum (strain ATCC 11539 / FP-39264 / Madison 617) TaxID=670483 RepID=S7Q5G1_GLOTA|nr:uncharacterized protein GLOTRDRAFT_121484 [Gloeophyllum trabeum ATCC 11539]EPQ55286.1 hypothetical protein GLOTRDRAFT_121484 [Gloeophyllum trabeum ATCC 11539]